MRERGNVAGADEVLAWRTGFPFGVNLSRGYPRFNPGEFTATEMLARGEVDAALVVADDPMTTLEGTSRAHLATIPYVAIGARETPTTRAAEVVFATSVYGINEAGTVYRMDDVPLPLRSVVPSNYPSDFEILSAIERRVRELVPAAG
jgi:formylmethanofuran dehydrogenase subunit B